jgi:hypothetical protein
MIFWLSFKLEKTLYLCMFALYQYHAMKVYVGGVMGVQLHPTAAFSLRKPNVIPWPESWVRPGDSLDA